MIHLLEYENCVSALKLLHLLLHYETTFERRLILVQNKNELLEIQYIYIYIYILLTVIGNSADP